MYTPEYTQLLEDYNRDRGCCFDEDQFAALVYTLPSALVANADGNIDAKERTYIRNLPKSLILGFKTASSIQKSDKSDLVFEDTFFEEVEYLLKNIQTWESRFLEALKAQLSNSLDERNTVFEMMWRTADSSDDISAEERARIEAISVILGL